MNNYEKMTLPSFLQNLRAKKYKNATGARRAVGKSQDLSNADKDKARAEIDKFFGVAAPKKAAKKIAPKAKAAPKKAAKKVAAKTKAAPAHKSTKAKRQPVAQASRGSRDAAPSTDARVMRQHAAAQVLSTFAGKQPLDSKLEAEILNTAALEYIANSSIADKPEEQANSTPAISRKERIARPRVNVSAKAVTKAEAPVDTDTPPESEPEHTNGVTDTSNWTEEDHAQDKKIGEMKAAFEGGASQS